MGERKNGAREGDSMPILLTSASYAGLIYPFINNILLIKIVQKQVEFDRTGERSPE